MSEEIKQWQEKLRQSFQGQDALIKFATQTLESIAHRYLNSPQLHSQGNLLYAEAREENMGEALKLSHPELKQQVKELAKRIPRAEKPAIVSRLIIALDELSADRGKVQVRAQASWGHPQHPLDGPQKLEKVLTLSWDDLNVYRKGLPLKLEEAADLFL